MQYQRDISHIELSEGTKQWIRYLDRRISQNKNFLGCFIGQTGSGKSYSSISLMELIHSGVIETDNIFMKSTDFIKRLHEGNLKKGTVLVWDEAGKDLNSKQWASKANKVMNVVFQIFRRENIIVLFTLPYFSFLDSDARKLVHGLFETQGIDTNSKEVIVKPLLIQTNQETGKMYKKFLRVKMPEEGLLPVKRIRLPMPNLEAIKYYENKKEEFSKEVYKEAYDMLMKAEGGDKPKKELNTEQKLVYNLILQGKDKNQIAEELYMDYRTVVSHAVRIGKILNQDINHELVQNMRKNRVLAKEKAKNEQNSPILEPNVSL
jgi:ABC-type dipeptide/oligopeptide/nickel transport system ATPase component/DNA-binding CsgD family transcriptional regulator